MIEKVLKFLKIHFASTLTLRDGTPIELSGNLETGVNAFISTPDGNIAMPDGEYSLSDDSIILVKDGIIMDVVNKDVETPLSAEVVEEEFKIDPKEGESKNDYIGRCISHEVGKGHEQQQAIAMCESMWESKGTKMSEETPIEEPIIEPVVETPAEEELQKGNPEVSGDEPTKEIEDEPTPTQSGSTTITEDLPKEEDMRTAELETKVAELSSKIDDIMGKLNLITEKFSAAQPIIKKKESDYQHTFDQDILDKVEIIKKLKKA